jgi:hypothetical protein
MNGSRRRNGVVCFATQGTGHADEDRIRALLDRLGADVLPFDRGNKARSSFRLLRLLLRRRPALVVMEGTGIAGGAVVIVTRVVARIPYVVSSGDAIGPYVALDHRMLAPVAGLYERLLCRLSAGFIGWTPYLAGRALTYGAPRAMTAAGWSETARPQDREQRREELGIPADAIVFGLIGSLAWTERVGYCYGKELVEAVQRTERQDVRVLVVGDGSGLERLSALAGEELGERIILPGRVPKEEVMSYLAAIDVASLPQSVDGVGLFRYTTKISEYIAAGLPMVTGRIPLAYDLDDGWIWRLGGDSPWDPRYVQDLAELMESLNPTDLSSKQRAVPGEASLFDRDRQQLQATAFISDLIEGSQRLDRGKC